MPGALGTSYDFQSSLPLLGRFSVDMPIAAMTAEAMQTVREQVREEVKGYWPMLLVAAVGASFVGAVLANWLVPARR